MIDIESVDSHTRSVIRVRLSGLDPVQGQYVTWKFVPDFAVIEYTRDFVGDAYVWRCGSATLSGFRLLAPGKDGAQRVGKQSHKHDWHTYNADLADPTAPTMSDGKMPRELRKLISELRPSGELTMPGE